MSLPFVARSPVSQSMVRKGPKRLPEVLASRRSLALNVGCSPLQGFLFL
jgi:hypothetical protein